MSRILALAAVVLMLCSGLALAQDNLPDLVGTWNITSAQLHVKNKGLIGEDGISGSITISKQRGRIIQGTAKWLFYGKGHSGVDRFSGVIAKDNKTVYIAAHHEGIRIVTIDGPDDMTLYSIVGGGNSPRAGYADLKRAK